MVVDSAVVLDVSAYFSDPDGDELTYSAETSDVAIATASVDGSVVTTTGVSAGEEGVQMVTLMVTASDPGGALGCAGGGRGRGCGGLRPPGKGLAINDHGGGHSLGRDDTAQRMLQPSASERVQRSNLTGYRPIHWTEWQIREGHRVGAGSRDPKRAADSRTRRTDVICGYEDLADREDGTPGPAPAGTYRVVGEVTIAEEGMDPVRIRRKTENEFIHEPGS